MRCCWGYTRRQFLFILLLGATSHAVCAQEAPSLINQAIPTRPQSPPAQFIQSWYSSFNVSPLREGVAIINLNLPNAPSQYVALELFEARAGYLYEDVDGDGDFDPVPDPDAAPDEISWRWYGRSSEWTVALTYEQGILAGRISGPTVRYAVAPRANGVTELGWINSSYWKTHSGDIEDGAAASIQVVPSTKTETISDISAATYSSKGSCPIEVDPWDSECSAPAPSGQSLIDVLMLYTPNNLLEYGSASGVRAVLQSAVDDANMSLRNAGVYTVRFWMRRTEVINTTVDPTDYQEIDFLDALPAFGGWQYQGTCPYITFPGNSYVLSRRNTYQADIVALSLIPNDPTAQTCGAATVQNSISAGYLTNPGPKFEKFSYLVFNPKCSADRLNFAHEAGHLLGLEHDPRNSTFAGGQVSGDASCPWSYAHRRAGPLSDPLRFRTVMAYWQQGNTSVAGPAGCGTSTDLGYCPLIDSYSNPGLQWNGSSVGSFPGMPNIGVAYPPPSGLLASREHDTLARIAPIVEAFRARTDLIFGDTFQ